MANARLEKACWTGLNSAEVLSSKPPTRIRSSLSKSSKSTTPRKIAGQHFEVNKEMTFCTVILVARQRGGSMLLRTYMLPSDTRSELALCMVCIVTCSVDQINSRAENLESIPVYKHIHVLILATAYSMIFISV